MIGDDAFEAWKRRARDADILDIAQSKIVGAKLKKTSREWIGACPRCPKTKDTFGVNPAKRVFVCRRGGIGGNVITMVMHARAVEFLAACELITGEPPPALGSRLTLEAKAAAEKARAESKANADRLEAEDNKWRADERRRTRDMYNQAALFAGSSAAAYLAQRGLTFPPTPEGRAERLKCIEALPYVVPRGREYEIIHRGPAMVAPIVDAARKQRGLHVTFIDLAQPDGKLKLTDPKTGEPVPGKKSRGSKRGNKVELIGPREPTALVIGEGIEKTLAVWRGMHDSGGVLESTAFWSACDLGNLAGPHADMVTHPTLKSAKGRAQKVAGATPDLDKPAIVIPDSVADLVLLGDSTSDPVTTQLAMCRAAARYARPGRTVRVAWAPAGADFDDLWRIASNDDERAAAAAQIVAIMESSTAPIVPALAPVESTPPLPRKAKSSAELDKKPSVSRSQRRKGIKSSDAQDSPDEAAAPSRACATKGAAENQTGAGAAGAPIDLPSASDPADAARGPSPPAGAASAVAEKTDRSRMGGNAARWADRTRWTGPPRKYGDDEHALDRWLATFPLTDLGNVERFVQRQRGRLIHCPAFGWLWWDGRRWSREGADGRATIAEHETVRAIQREADAIVGTDQDIQIGGDKDDPIMLSDKLYAWGRTSENASRLNPISRRAAPSLAAEPHELDADPFKINLRNGTLVVRKVFTDADGDWQSWERISACIRIKPHDPDDLITKVSPVAFDARALSPEYDGFMNLVQPSAGNQRFIDDFDGYSFTGDATEQVLVFHHGTGKNGKTTQIAIKLYILGDYGRSIPIDTFAQEGRARQAGQATPDLAMLHRVRYLSTSEPQKNWKLDEALIKVLTGGDEVPVRELHKPYFMLRPEFKLGMNGNFKPRIDGGEKESGIWRRVKLVPWAVKIPAEQRDKHFGDRLKAEAAGILNRMLRGLERWMMQGLIDAPEVAAATEQFRQDSDPLGRFLEFCTRPTGDGRVQTTALYQVFQAWARAFGESEWKPNGFGRAMTERGYLSKKSDLNYWLGIELVKAVRDFVDGDGQPLVLRDDGGGAGSDRPDKPPAPRPGAREAWSATVENELEGF